MASTRRCGHDRAILARTGTGTATEDTDTDAMLAARAHVYLAIYTVVRITSSVYLCRGDAK
jgi:hypothetical protein